MASMQCLAYRNAAWRILTMDVRIYHKYLLHLCIIEDYIIFDNFSDSQELKPFILVFGVTSNCFWPEVISFF